ncbi:uncharacterized protein LOC127159618 [Labeo rohita]|uniref:uncharacterized protein LOC127159618 n=1 Tax=Labeo rohita TaxID=84645 RepID=UPI0021E21E4E|nr:uncharacterized protein LOC127159618 [Labeo rohita]
MLKCLNILKIMQLLLYVLMWCRAAETLTDQLTDLGQNVTINCDLDVNEVIWSLLKLDSPVLILRTFTTTAPFYLNNTFRDKYKVQSKNNLFIINVTIDDLGVYYCMKIDPPQKYSSGTRLYIIVVECTEENQTRWHITILISALLNVLLITVITGLLRSLIYGTRDKHFKELQVMDFEQSQDSTQVQYVTVDFPRYVKGFSPATLHFYSCRKQDLLYPQTPCSSV